MLRPITPTVADTAVSSAYRLPTLKIHNCGEQEAIFASGLMQDLATRTMSQNPTGHPVEYLFAHYPFLNPRDHLRRVWCERYATLEPGLRKGVIQSPLCYFSFAPTYEAYAMNLLTFMKPIF